MKMVMRLLLAIITVIAVFTLPVLQWDIAINNNTQTAFILLDNTAVILVIAVAVILALTIIIKFKYRKAVDCFVILVSFGVMYSLYMRTRNPVGYLSDGTTVDAEVKPGLYIVMSLLVLQSVVSLADLLSKKEKN